MDAGTVSSFADEIGDVAKGERAALKYSSPEAPPGIKNPDQQSPYGRQLLKGQEVEKEHKDTIGWLKKNPDAPLEAATRSIASDHLDEDRKYYTHLKEMEDKYKEAMVHGLFDELEKIGGGGIMKALSTDITPGYGPLLPRLKRGFGDVGRALKNQVQRHGVKGLVG